MKNNHELLLTTQCKKLTPYLWPLLLGFLTILSVASYYNYHWHKQSLISERTTVAKQAALKGQLLLEKILQQKFQHIEDSIRLLAENSPLKHYAQTHSAEMRQIVEQQWILLSQNSGLYTQIRFVDPQGMEKIRINYNAESGEATVANKLQYKGNRPYMLEAKNLKPSEVAVIAFDVESEFGQIVRPLKQAGRVITPLTIDGQRLGYVLFNLDMSEVMSLIDEQERVNQLSIEVMTNDGHYIRSEDPAHAYGHVLPSRQKFSLALSDNNTWQKMQADSEGVLRLDKGYLTYRWVNFNLRQRLMPHSTQRLLILTHIRDNDIQLATHEAISTANSSWLLRLALILSISIVASLWLQRWLTRFKTQKLMLSAISSMSSVIITDQNNRLVGVNRAFEQLTGYQSGDIVKKVPEMFEAINQSFEEFQGSVKSIIANHGRWQGEMRCICADGRTLNIWLEASAIHSGKGQQNVDYYVANFIDITKQKRLESQLVKLSNTDALTGAYNRRRFDEELNRLSRIADRYANNQFCLAILDLDHFKAVNDTHGHDVGDEVLKTVVSHIHPLLRETDFFARLGGEEFAVLMPHTEISAAISVAERLRNEIEHANIVPKVTMSIGVVAYQANMPETELYRRADIALYQAKALGRNRVMSDDCQRVDNTTNLIGGVSTVTL
ncbi:sensor domain-containing diguanylate cyclase [Corallincola spongiicola]|uniref:diguanylate cyclase n=1 Tax=Corallincola spongiicola TaxID=2520508 RepID=A0ABY1WLD7_9GAMM|nr:sensor domain-containing diguanylate cyclase [Corallincola spongiicola]TAA41048.1 sensor domain-containing diguanylate cyclase [Corallincola spongiicola]